MKKSLGFTLAEVLITLAIIGVVAAMTIPSVIVSTNQAEFKTGLKKAISVLNSAVSLNTASEGDTPFDTDDLSTYLQRHMSVISVQDAVSGKTAGAFTVADGMRFEFPTSKDVGNLSALITEASDNRPKYYDEDEGDYKTETNSLEFKFPTTAEGSTVAKVGNCGSLNYLGDPNETGQNPCLIVVDVNGDKKPHVYGDDYAFVLAKTETSTDTPPVTTYGSAPKRLNDTFAIMITDEKVLPVGLAAQFAMYTDKK